MGLKISRRLLPFAIILLCKAAASELILHGVSAYEQLNREYYLGALYTVAPMSDANEILNDSRPQKMIMKVTTRRWSPHKFNEIWRQDLAMNNDLGADLTLTTHILEFTSLPQDNLTEGDELVIGFSLAEGTSVFLNGQRLMQTLDKGLFNTILKTWIGDVPPSRLFRSDILNQESIVTSKRDQLTVRFHQTNIQPDRLDLVAQWQSLEQQAQRALALAEEELRKQQQRETERQQAAAAEQRRLEQERQAALALAEQRRKEAEAERQRTAQAAQSNTATTTTTTSAANEEARRLAAQREAERLAAERRAAELAAAQEKERQAQVAGQYALDLYRWEVLADVYRRVSYPEWARQFNQQGIITVEFIVNRSGQLVGITGVSPQDSGLLGQELRDAVRLSAPFKAFPAEFEANQLLIAIDYNFSLRERVAELPPKPVAPEGLSIELTEAQKELQWASYQEQVSAKIQAEIQYPFWAQDLRQEGKVVVAVTVNKDGTIGNVTLKQRARHAILNQEVEQAVARLGNLSAFPDWVSESSLTLEIEHNFKL